MFHWSGELEVPRALPLRVADVRQEIVAVRAPFLLDRAFTLCFVNTLPETIFVRMIVKVVCK